MIFFLHERVTYFFGQYMCYYKKKMFHTSNKWHRRTATRHITRKKIIFVRCYFWVKISKHHICCKLLANHPAGGLKYKCLAVEQIHKNNSLNFSNNSSILIRVYEPLKRKFLEVTKFIYQKYKEVIKQFLQNSVSKKWMARFKHKTKNDYFGNSKWSK